MSNMINRSDLTLRTKKEATSQADSVSTEILERAGFISSFGSGLFGLTILGTETKKRIEECIREEHIHNLNCHEVSIPSLQYSEDWKKSGRWKKFESEMFTFENRDGKEMCLAPTHEEGIVRMFKNNVRSYKDLPFSVFQIKQKHRDDHARNGLLRSKEFVMKDAYSMHRDRSSMYEKYEKMKEGYLNIFEKLGLKVATVESDVGVMGGNQSMEFVAPGESGDDSLLYCTDCWSGLTDESEKFEDYGNGDNCPFCENGSLEESTGIEVGHIFALGKEYSTSMNFNFYNEKGEEEQVYMGSYGIGVTRVMQAIIEQNGNSDSCNWESTDWGTVAPFDVCVISSPEVEDKEINKVCEKLSGTERVLIYDEMNMGEQFAESDLIGIPNKIILGNHWRDENEVEIERYDGSKEYCNIESLGQLF